MSQVPDGKYKEGRHKPSFMSVVHDLNTAITMNGVAKDNANVAQHVTHWPSFEHLDRGELAVVLKLAMFKLTHVLNALDTSTGLIERAIKEVEKEDFDALPF